MPDLVRITDVAPRDGLQNEPGVIPTEEKVELIRLLCETGVDEVEVTSFVSPKWVPQLGDAAEVIELLHSPSQREGPGVGSGGKPLHDLPPAPPRFRPPARNPLAMHRARELRQDQTGPEWTLWNILRDRAATGAKFRRQHPFGPYILDFFCQEKLLAVELDGHTHRSAEAEQHDRERDDWVASQGVLTLRFTNDAVIADAAAVVTKIRAALDARPSLGVRKPTPQPPPSGRGSRSPVFSALVPNERGLQGVLDANVRAKRPLISKVSLFTAASESFCRRNINASIGESIERFIPVILAARNAGLRIRGYISCVIACPFEGPIAPRAVVEVSRRLIDAGIDELDLADTIGAATPESTAAVLRDVSHVRALTDPETFTLHFHDTFGRAADCVKTALDLGVRSFDGSVAGLGGCPYASTPGKQAPGNISTQTLVRTIHDAGHRTHVDLDKLEEAGRFAMKMVTASRHRAAQAATDAEPRAGEPPVPPGAGASA